MKPTPMLIYLNVSGILLFLAAAFYTEDILMNELYTALVLLVSVNTIRLISEQNSKTDKPHEKKTSI